MPRFVSNEAPLIRQYTQPHLYFGLNSEVFRQTRWMRELREYGIHNIGGRRCSIRASGKCLQNNLTHPARLHETTLLGTNGLKV